MEHGVAFPRFDLTSADRRFAPIAGLTTHWRSNFSVWLLDGMDFNPFGFYASTSADWTTGKYANFAETHERQAMPIEPDAKNRVYFSNNDACQLVLPFHLASLTMGAMQTRKSHRKRPEKNQSSKCKWSYIIYVFVNQNFDNLKCADFNRAIIAQQFTIQPSFSSSCASYGLLGHANLMNNKIVILYEDRKDKSLVDQAKYADLNFKLSNFIRCGKVHGVAQSELIFLSCRMNDDGCGLLGDVVQMSQQKILLYAKSDSRIRNPHNTVHQLERLLSTLGLSFNMQAPGWNRSPRPCFEQEIARRNLFMEMNIRPRPLASHLRLIRSEL